MQKLIKHLSPTNSKTHVLISVDMRCWQLWLKYDALRIVVQFLHIFMTETLSGPATVNESVIYDIVLWC